MNDGARSLGLAKPPSRAEMRSRAESLPEELSRLLREKEAALPEEISAVQRFDVTGIGASEGPARLLVSVLVDAGRLARFVPAAAFVHEQNGEGAALIVFSQGLCPNARLALRQAPRYGTAVLFTAVTGEEKDGPRKGAVLRGFRDAGGFVYGHPPASEGGSLVRLVGPACALLAALRFSRALLERGDGLMPGWLRELELVPEAVARSYRLERPRVVGEPAAFVGLGSATTLLPSLAWKWQEALYAPLPHVFDVLSFMHGPLQSLHERPSTLVFCTPRSNEAELELKERLRRVLTKEPHQLIELETSLEGPLAWFELDAAVNRLVLGEMESRGIEPGAWPAQGHDAPLYQVGE